MQFYLQTTSVVLSIHASCGLVCNKYPPVFLLASMPETSLVLYINPVVLMSIFFSALYVIDSSKNSVFPRNYATGAILHAHCGSLCQLSHSRLTCLIFRYCPFCSEIWAHCISYSLVTSSSIFLDVMLAFGCIIACSTHSA